MKEPSAAVVRKKLAGMNVVKETSEHVIMKTIPLCTPESAMSGYTSATAKRKLDLEDVKPKAKRRRTVGHVGSSYSKKRIQVKLDTMSWKASGQKTIHFYFRPT